MKIKIIVEDEKKGKVEIPFSIKEARELYDVGFGSSINEKYVGPISKAFAKVIDCFDDGRCYEFINKKLKLCNHKYYHGGHKPRWK